MACRITLEDGSGFLLLEDGSGFLQLETCEDDQIAYSGNRYRDYQPTYYELQARRNIEKQIESTKIDIKATNLRIEDVELTRLRDLADERMQKELIALLMEDQRLQLLLVEQQTRLAMLRDEDDALILLMAFN